jgi:hypothetical protein
MMSHSTIPVAKATLMTRTLKIKFYSHLTNFIVSITIVAKLHITYVYIFQFLRLLLQNIINFRAQVSLKLLTLSSWVFAQY